MRDNILQVVSYNCQGLNSAEKRRDVFNYLKSKNCNIYCLQDTHFTVKDECSIRNLWGGDCIFNSFSSNQRGVAILINKNFEYKIIKTKNDDHGNLLAIDMEIEHKKITLINLYGPNNNFPEFFNKVSEIIENFDNQTVIMAGDYNLVQDQSLDTHNYRNINNPKAKDKILDLMDIHNLSDPFREMYPETKRYTWRKSNPLKQARLDFFLISQSFYHNVHDIKIHNSYRSDHSPVILQFKLSDFTIGRGLWKFNNTLLHDIEYIEAIKKIIKNVKEQYACLVYNSDNIDEIDDLEIQFTINDQLFLETLLTEIRGKSISFASFRKKEINKLESKLSEDIRILENNLQTDEVLADIEKKKSDLKILRQEKMRGHYIRSKMQWIEEGEKPSKYFINLETKNFVNKTIPKLVNNEGVVIDNQKQILEEAKSYYQNLYGKKEILNSLDLNQEILYDNIPKLKNNTKESLEGEITFLELTATIKNMKNGKSPGSDGYTTEFFKFFWKDIGKFVFRSIRYGYNQGELSVTQKQGIITCIPKGDKPRQYMKNWRPISLLNTVYKLASSCIAERIKSVLPTLISTDQTGFIPGRFIGENTRLIYDILHFTEENDILGILLLIDFEKAFDSISSTFIEHVLDFFNFGSSITHWIKTFYTNIQSAVTQNCFLSEFFNIQRGCRQGDPLSPYIFILCAEILGILVRHNDEIKGITIDDTEFLISQYADDTSLILDGSPESLGASLYLLQKYSDMSGLKMNLEKTKVVWIGKKEI